MPSIAVNICVITLVLLSIQHTCHSRPHSHSKREIIKDYFKPLVMTSQEFEKGEDGKYQLKKSSYRSDSTVNYVNPETTDDKNGIFENGLIATDVETLKDEIEAAEVGEIKNEPLTEIVAEEEHSEKLEVSSTPPLVKEEKIVKEFILPKLETVQEEKVYFNEEKAPFTPVDPKLVVPLKPDSKDEVPVKTDLTPMVEDEKVNQKVSIGQVPHFFPRGIPMPNSFRIPILIPIRQISYRTMSVLPLPSADASDRLPYPLSEGSDRLPMALDDDIIGEGEHESTAVKEIAEPAKDKKDVGYPLPHGLRLPLLSFSGLLEDLRDSEKQGGEKQTKVVDVLGKKFLMQSNVMKFPSGDNSNTFVRFMSMKPLESVDPEKTEEAAAEEAIKKVIEEVKHQQSEKLDKEKELMAKEDEMMKDEEKKRVDQGIRKEIEVELVKEPEILKVEETQIKVHVDPQVPKEIAMKEISGQDMNSKKPNLKEIDSDMISEEKINKIKNSFIEEMGPPEKIEEIAMKSLDKESEIKILEEKLDSDEEKEAEEKAVEDEKVVFAQDWKKKMGDADALMKKDTDMASKEEFFFVENKKKGMTFEEEAKPKKNIEKKKKKCKCEEEDSDTDDDDE